MVRHQMFMMTKLNTAIKCILQLVEALRYKKGGYGVDSQQGPWKFSSDLFLCSCRLPTLLMPSDRTELGRFQPFMGHEGL